MKRLVPIASILLVVASTAPVVAASIPRIVILAPKGVEPPPKAVKEIVAEHLKQLKIELEIATTALEDTPATTSAWLKTGARVARHPGTVAVFGYTCEKKRCRLIVIEPNHDSVVELPLTQATDDDTPLAFSLAATLREALLGPLLPEVARLVEQGRSPKKPAPTPQETWVRPPEEEARREPPSTQRPWLWLEGGYQGDHPHPNGRPIHGPWVGVDMEPAHITGMTVSLGWLGIRRADIEGASVAIHRLTTAFSIRLILPVGPAHFTMAPMARLDVAFASLDNVGRDDADEVNVEFELGGMVTWHLPLRKHLDFMVGAGLLAAILSNRIEVYVRRGQPETALPASTLRMLWMAGLAWSPFKPADVKPQPR
jgi:hypothetical protein